MWRPLIPAGIVILLGAVGFGIAGLAVNKAIAPTSTINKQRLAQRVSLAEKGLCEHHSPACRFGLAKAQLQRKGGHEPTVEEIEAAAERAVARLLAAEHASTPAPRHRVRSEPAPSFVGPNGKPLTAKEAAAFVRRMEARCRAEHQPCNVLGGVVLSTRRYKVQIR